jgi:hypothetical protein
MEESKNSVGSLQQAKWVRREDSAEVYSNMFFLDWSATDVRVRFGQMIPTTTERENNMVPFIIEENAAVTMTWAQIKALRDGLANAVERYERTNGEIDFSRITLPK